MPENVSFLRGSLETNILYNNVHNSHTCTLMHTFVMGVCVLQGLEENMGYLVGDCLLAASFLSYMGPFLSNYRDELLAIWMKEVRHTSTPTHTS